MRLENKVAVVTGAAGGIGAATARLFAGEGAKVVLADYMGERAQANAEAIVADGGEAIGLQFDARQSADVERVIQVALDAWGRLDVLHNNVGVNFHDVVGDASEAHFLECLNINLLSVYRGCHFAAPVMQRQASGSIINTSSVQALMGFRTFAAYATAKAGILGLTRQMAVDYAPDNIRVNAILPGGVDTPMWRAEAATLPDINTAIAESAARIPLGRLGTPDDIAYCAMYLASDESAWVTGQSFVIDGGLSIAGNRPSE